MAINSSKLYKFYLALVSFVALVAIAINLGVLLTSIGKYLLITDNEYLQHREYYKIEQCENTGTPTGRFINNEQEKQKTPSEEDIKECKQKVKDSVSASRSFDLKEMFISSGAWFIVFLVVFLIHYPQFLKSRRED